MPPFLPLILQAPSQYSHDLLVAFNVIGRLGDFCRGTQDLDHNHFVYIES